MAELCLDGMEISEWTGLGQTHKIQMRAQLHVDTGTGVYPIELLIDT